MAIQTIWQKANTDKLAYGVQAGAVWEDVMYLPYQESGTKRVDVLLDAVLGNDSTDYDFAVDAAAATNPPRSVLTSDNMNITFHALSAVKSWVRRHSAPPGVLATTPLFKLGTESRAPMGSISLEPGTGTANYSDSSKDEATASTTLNTGDKMVLALVMDRIAGTLTLYEATAGNVLVEVAQDASLTASALAFTEPTPIAINQVIGTATYGTVFLSTDANIPLPSDILANLADTAENWFAGTLGINLLT